MTILRYEPWSLVNRLHRQLDQAFSADAGDSDGAWWIPQVDVHEEPERFAVLVDVPGVEPKDIEITAEKGVLTVRGERHARAQDESSAYRRLERRSGKFLRRFTPPGERQSRLDHRQAHARRARGDDPEAGEAAAAPHRGRGGLRPRAARPGARLPAAPGPRYRCYCGLRPAPRTCRIGAP